MRLRNRATGVVVTVDDARGADMVGSDWEKPDEQSKGSASKTASPPERSKPKR